MRVAIVHHWFVTRGGGERVAECLASLFPEATIFTLLADAPGIPDSMKHREIRTSFLQKIPLARRFHRHMMPLYPAATEALDLRGFDLVISSDSGPVKGVLIDKCATHICYCHSPMRYLWDEFASYQADMGLLTRTAFSATAARVREWDLRAAQRVTFFLANSGYVAGRILRSYGRESTVIHPPIDTGRIPSARHANGAYLCAGRLVGYKKTSMIIEACSRLGRKLRIAGTGPEEAQLQKMAPPGVTFLGALSNEALWQEYADCRALVFAADEDFGMVPLEAQACGRPVIAYGAGGSLETVRGVWADLEEPAAIARGMTGVYFREQEVDSLVRGILHFEEVEAAGFFDSQEIASWAAGFDTSIFLKNIRDFVLSHVPSASASMLPDAEAESVEE